MSVKRKINIRRRKIAKPMKSTTLPSMGDLSAPVMLILDPVVGNENATSPLNKGQWDWLRGKLQKHGNFKKEDICIVSSAPGVTHDTWALGSLTNAHMKEHRDEVLKLIARNKPKFIIPLGAKACQQVIGRAVQITKVRGQAIEDDNIANGIPVLPLYSPFYAQRHPEFEATFEADLRTASRIHESDFDVESSVLEYKHEYKWCTDLGFLLKKRPKQISVDIEGVGLIPFAKETRLLTVQICYAKGKVICVPIDYDAGDLRHHNSKHWHQGQRKKIVKQLKRLLEDPRIRVFGQNFKFDWLYLHYKLGIQVANYADDTMLLAHLHDENQKRINLDDLVRQHVPEMAGFNDVLNADPEHHGKSRMDLLTPEKMLKYACGDADATWRLLDNLKELIGEDAKLLQCYNKVTMAAMRAFCYVELNGFPVDEEELYSFERYLTKVQAKEYKYIMSRIPAAIRDEFRNTGVGLKVTRAELLRAYLYTHKKGLKLKPVKYTKTKLPSVSSKEALPYYVADHAIVQRIIDYIKNDKMLTTYAKGFHKYIYDEMIRPSYGLANTVTGRSMSRDPNGQNFPKRGPMAKKYRKIFKATKGWVFVACDLSQAELRIAAMMSGDENMLQVYRDGGDIHKSTAAGTMGLTIEEFDKLPHATKSMKRFQAKAVNFGFLYGMWWVKFRSYAKTDYGIEFTEDEAKEIRERFFQTYPMLEVWHRDVGEIVMENGYIRTYDGRIRHLPMVHSSDEGIAKQALRQGINSPVQAIASDLGLMTLGRLMPYINKHKLDWIKPCGFIHDAIVCLVREDKVAHGADLVKRFMENNPLEEWFGWDPEIPILADAEIGRTLATTYEIGNDQFVGKANRHKSYTDLLREEADKLVAERSKLGIRDKGRVAITKDINKILEDIGDKGTVTKFKVRKKPSPKRIRKRKLAA